MFYERAKLTGVLYKHAGIQARRYNGWSYNIHIASTRSNEDIEDFDIVFFFLCLK